RRILARVGEPHQGMARDCSHLGRWALLGCATQPRLPLRSLASAITLMVQQQVPVRAGDEGNRMAGGKSSGHRELPTGVVTVMFTDVVDSTRLKCAMAAETAGRRDEIYRSTVKVPHD